MKVISITRTLVALCLLPAGIASAQDATQQNVTRPKAIQADTRVAKSADLRLKLVHAQCAAKAAGKQPKKTTQDDPQTAEQANGVDRGHLVDFMARAAKRADLRLRISQVGTVEACAEWIQREGGR